jgi:hypothetical protein
MRLRLRLRLRLQRAPRIGGADGRGAAGNRRPRRNGDGRARRGPRQAPQAQRRRAGEARAATGAPGATATGGRGAGRDRRPRRNGDKRPRRDGDRRPRRNGDKRPRRDGDRRPRRNGDKRPRRDGDRRPESPARVAGARRRGGRRLAGRCPKCRKSSRRSVQTRDKPAQRAYVVKAAAARGLSRHKPGPWRVWPPATFEVNFPARALRSAPPPASPLGRFSPLRHRLRRSQASLHSTTGYPLAAFRSTPPPTGRLGPPRPVAARASHDAPSNVAGHAFAPRRVGAPRPPSRDPATPQLHLATPPTAAPRPPAPRPAPPTAPPAPQLRAPRPPAPPPAPPPAAPAPPAAPPDHTGSPTRMHKYANWSNCGRVSPGSTFATGPPEAQTTRQERP